MAGGQEQPPDDIHARLTAEFIGTFMLVLTVGCNVLTGSPVWAVTSIACCLMASIYGLGCISGANFNPAVSWALFMSGDNSMPKSRLTLYIPVQLFAGLVAGLVYGVSLWKVFNLEPTSGYDWWQAALAEIFYTFMLCFVVLNCCGDGRTTEFYGLAIGFVIVAGGYGAGHISGGCFNPAVAVGIDLSSAGLGFGWSVAYTVFEMIGATLAALLYRVVRPKDETRAPTKLANLTSEFLGTYMLVLTVGLNVLGGSKAPVFSIAAALMCMIFALGDVSGAHFNPAVTVSILVRGDNKIETPDAVSFMGAQLLAGLLAGFTYSLMEGWKTFPLAPGTGYILFEACVAEVFFTFVLCYVVLSVATVREDATNKHFFGLAIGSCVTTGGYAIGAISGGSLNPAVSFGIAAVHGCISRSMGTVGVACVYALAEVIGGVLAAVTFKITHACKL